MVYSSPAIRSLAESIHELNRRVDGLESPQLSHSSLDNFYLNVYDDEGNKTGEIGRLPDGSTGVNTIDGPTPVAPTGITSEPGVGNLSVTWDGTFSGDAAAPLDFKHVAVHASPTADFEPTSENVVTTFSSVEPTSRVVPLKAGTYLLKATTLSIPGKRSAATAEVEAVAGALVDEDSITEALETERTKRQEAAQAAEETLTELDNKLANITGDSGELVSIRSALADAQEAVAATQTTASEAVTAANAASQAALEAAGLAASKGRVIVQATEPAGEDRKASNIWIQPVPDDPETEVQEKAVTYVYLEASDSWEPTTSSELAQAAQNALDAREQAQQAQQRADTAIANAAAAQSAAEAAQRTADDATLSAREAHNEAVAAQEKLDALKIGSVNLLNDSLNFRTISSDTSASRVHTDTDRGGRVEILDSNWRNAYGWVQSRIADEDFYANAGHQYTLSVDVRASFADPTTAVRLGIDVRGTGLRVPVTTEFSDTGGRWQRISVTLTIPDEIGSSSLVSFSSVNYSRVEGDVFEYRDFKLEKGNRGTDWTPSLADQQAVVDAAQARADEAYVEAEKKLDESQVQAIADLSQAAAEAASLAEIEAAESRAATEALRVAKAEAAREAGEAESAAKAYADLIDTGASDADLAAARKYAEEQAEEARIAAEKAAALDATAKTEAAEARSATDAKNKADAALAAAKAALADARGEITTQINTSANGKNSITRSTSNASGSGVVAGDAWYKVDSNGDTIAMWIWSGSKWVASKVRNEMIDTIDVNKLKVHDDLEVIGDAVINKIWADGIAAKSAVFNSLTVASGNVYPNTSLELPLQWESSGSITHYPDGGHSGGGSLLIEAGTTARGYYDTYTAWAHYRTPVADGRPYTISFMLRPSATMPPGAFTVYLQGYTSAGSSAVGSRAPLVSVTNTSEYPSATWSRVDLTMRPGEGSVEFALGLYLNSSFASSARISDISVRPAVDAVLIEDGAISADKITADAITAEKIEAGAIETPHMKANSINADRLTANSIKADKIDSTSIGTELITAGTLRTGTTGERLELNSQGVVLYGADAEAGETVRLGPSGENLLTIGSSTISSDSISATTGNYDSLSIGGQSITELLDNLPRGMRAWGELTTDSQYDSDTGNYARRGELQTTLEPDRLYRMAISSHYIQTNFSSNTRAVEELRYSYDATPIYWDLNPGTGNYRGAQYRHLITSGNAYVASGMEFMLNTSGWSSNRIFWLMWMIRPEHGSAAVRVLARGDYAPILSIEDLGPAMSPTLKRWNDGNGGEAQDTAPTITRRTDTWGAGGYGGDTGSGEVIQGQYGSYGNRSGSWKFTSAMQTALRGSTIEKFEVYLYASHWYHGSGGVASIRPTTGAYKSFTGSAFTSANWPRNAGRWVKVPSSWHASIANGTYKGIGVQTGSSSLSYYGRFTGTATKFRATYRA